MNTNPNAVDPERIHEKVVDEYGDDAAEYASVHRVLVRAYRRGLIDTPVSK